MDSFFCRSNDVDIIFCNKLSLVNLISPLFLLFSLNEWRIQWCNCITSFACNCRLEVWLWCTIVFYSIVLFSFGVKIHTSTVHPVPCCVRICQFKYLLSQSLNFEIGPIILKFTSHPTIFLKPIIIHHPIPPLHPLTQNIDSPSIIFGVFSLKCFSYWLIHLIEFFHYWDLCSFSSLIPSRVTTHFLCWLEGWKKWKYFIAKIHPWLLPEQQQGYKSKYYSQII